MVARLMTRVKPIMGEEIFRIAVRVRLPMRKLEGRKSKPKDSRCRTR